MKITMLATRRGSEDGHVVKRFYEGETYEVADTLARSFIANGWAYPVESSLFETFKGIAKTFDESRP